MAGHFASEEAIKTAATIFLAKAKQAKGLEMENSVNRNSKIYTENSARGEYVCGLALWQLPSLVPNLVPSNSVPSNSVPP